MKAAPKRVVVVVVAVAVIAGAMALYVFLKEPFRYAGTLEATKVDLSARLAAAIEEVRVQEGERVKEGETLVALACEDYKLAAKLARENYERNLRLSKIGSVSAEAMDQVRNQKETADVRLAWCTIESPIEGKVLSRYHEPGEWVSPGTKILTLANVRDIWAYIYVPQPLIARLSPGMTLTGYLPELGDRAFEGTIVKINDEAEFTPKNVQTRTERERLVFGVKVSFRDANADEILKPGMTIEVALPDAAP
ncbi:secretion protein HlyD [Sulfurifustis variabilis]|uniref:Secretion protein HlyD n=1 Tax=Sulfurifustis variabilis TaxID=1675686 RepID=A0A1B4V6X5_9GAMM|nr:efflux RND transporter periplasmic adaptor subunit [Sulfurifustis variabilis]BAU48342.1 secretion protein HlyD [Sulfurifustis variabilis]